MDSIFAEFLESKSPESSCFWESRADIVFWPKVKTQPIVVTITILMSSTAKKQLNLIDKVLISTTWHYLIATHKKTTSMGRKRWREWRDNLLKFDQELLQAACFNENEGNTDRLKADTWSKRPSFWDSKAPVEVRGVCLGFKIRASMRMAFNEETAKNRHTDWRRTESLVSKRPELGARSIIRLWKLCEINFLTESQKTSDFCWESRNIRHLWKGI